jgi:hypothetical protein
MNLTEMIQASVSKTILLADFLLQKVTTDPHIFAHVNTGRPEDRGIQN